MKTSSKHSDVESDCVILTLSFRRRLEADTTGAGTLATPLQLAKLRERANALRRRIETWQQVQLLYIPALAVIRARSDHTISLVEKPYLMRLLLPSSLPSIVTCDIKLYNYEWQLRNAQASDALAELRHHLQLRSHMYFHKDRFVRGQSANTRARNLIARVNTKVDASATKYRTSRKALVKLAAKMGKGAAWQDRLKVLNPVDIRQMAEGEDGESDGRKKLSWIWMALGVEGDSDDEGLHEGEYDRHKLIDIFLTSNPIALRIEWCRSRARAMRWTEEVLLLLEEMRRVLAFMEWHASWWEGQSARWSGLDAAESEGMAAYAYRQASIRRSMATLFRKNWAFAQQYVDTVGDGIDSDILFVNTVLT